MKQNTKIVAGVILLLLVIIGALFFMGSRKGNKVVVFEGDATITMGEDSYTPLNIRIKKGSKVKFVNDSDSLHWPASDLHPSHLIFPEFDPKQPVEKGQSWEFQFDIVGTWGYHDHLAPYITGNIEVTE